MPFRRHFYVTFLQKPSREPGRQHGGWWWVAEPLCPRGPGWMGSSVIGERRSPCQKHLGGGPGPRRSGGGLLHPKKHSWQEENGFECSTTPFHPPETLSNPARVPPRFADGEAQMYRQPGDQAKVRAGPRAWKATPTPSSLHACPLAQVG